ncbi:MAG TPA: calcium/sodium antiporter [Nitrospinota bacterium]|nr:calcium/sodium antiporter [Nitrospinota bacterium]|tara:strand:+ start:120483 stop:121451 length:969 start_codon:yes stop_codon:yes gene_type:complete
MIVNTVLLIAGLLMLYYGAEWLVKGSASAAIILGIKPVIIGLTVIAVGTSTPELITCLIAAYRDSNDIAIGNIIGSNIANIGLVLGFASLLAPIGGQWRKTTPGLSIMLLFTCLFIALCMDKSISRIDGVILFVPFVTFLVYTTKLASNQKKENLISNSPSDQILDKSYSAKNVIPLTLFGTLCLVTGAYLLVESATEMARYFGVSELIIGITIVAIGTSLPELATTIVAAFRGHAELAFGNIVGSNIFNIGMVLGITAMLKPLTADLSIIWIEVAALLFFTLAMAPMKWSGKIGRPLGTFLLVAYLGFILWLGLLKASTGA